MKIGFWVPRTTFLKVFGPVIEQALKRNHSIVIFYEPGLPPESSKAYQNISDAHLASLIDLGAQAVEVNIHELAQNVIDAGIQTFVTLEGYYFFRGKNQLAVLDRIKRAEIKLIQIAHFFEIAQQPIDVALGYFDLTLYMSEFGRNLHFDMFSIDNKRIEQLLSKTAITGFPAFDLLNRENKAEIREELGVPAEKKIVLLTAPVLSPAKSWRFTVWREPGLWPRLKFAIKRKRWQYIWEILTGESFKQNVDAVREFCDRNNAILVVKSRQKQDDPEYLIQAADIYISGGNETYYPSFSTYRLISISDLLVTAMSMSAMEAVGARVPVLNIAIPSFGSKTPYSEPLSEIAKKYRNITLSIQKGSLFNMPGCIISVDRRRFSGWLKKKSLGDFVIDETVWKDYSQFYLGLGEKTCSELVLENLEGLVNN